jgi:hypothetical protein
MLRYVFRLLLLLAVCHHAAALPGAWQSGVAPSQSARHTLLHWQGQPHHHHDDGVVHELGGAESTQHLHGDDALQSPALIAALPACTSVQWVRLTVTPLAETEPDTAFLARLERPPRAPR